MVLSKNGTKTEDLTLRFPEEGSTITTADTVTVGGETTNEPYEYAQPVDSYPANRAMTFALILGTLIMTLLVRRFAPERVEEATESFKKEYWKNANAGGGLWATMIFLFPVFAVGALITKFSAVTLPLSFALGLVAVGLLTLLMLSWIFASTIAFSVIGDWILNRINQPHGPYKALATAAVAAIPVALLPTQVTGLLFVVYILAISMPAYGAAARSVLAALRK